VRGFVLVTRNVADVRGCDVQVLDPFVKNPVVENGLNDGSGRQMALTGRCA
jgi:hypothetical protein